MLCSRSAPEEVQLRQSVIGSLCCSIKWDSVRWWVRRRSCRTMRVNIIKRPVPVVHSKKTIKTVKDRSSTSSNWSNSVLITAQVSIFIVKWSLEAAAASIIPKRCSVDALSHEMYFLYLLLLLWFDVTSFVLLSQRCYSQWVFVLK